MGKLSNKPSTILLQALEDLEAVEKSKKIKINMGDWVNGSERTGSKCEVCHAGACMVNRLGVSTEDYTEAHDRRFDRKTRAKLFFINEIREGRIEDALRSLHEEGVITKYQYDLALDSLGEDYKKDEYGDSEGDTLTGVPSDVSMYQGIKNRRLYKEYIQFVAGVFKSIGL